jgi:ribosomal protein S18 acetylase RimI-like enzyme
MPDPARAVAALEVRELRRGDLEEVIRIDALHTGRAEPDYWKRVFADFLGRGADRPRVGLAAAGEGRLLGYLLGEVRAFEFGSEACGWVFGVGVDPRGLRRGVGSTLLGEACRRFRAAGVRSIRTMVRRNNVPVLSFFRANGFTAGSFVQLELGLEEEP